jgi:hypothetical protein
MLGKPAVASKFPAHQARIILVLMVDRWFEFIQGRFRRIFVFVSQHLDCDASCFDDERLCRSTSHIERWSDTCSDGFVQVRKIFLGMPEAAISTGPSNLGSIAHCRGAHKSAHLWTEMAYRSCSSRVL